MTTNRREKMKQAHGGSGDFPKIEIARRYDLRTEEGTPHFRYYDSEKQEDVFSRKPIQGVLLGTANVMSAFDDDLGSKGGTYFTTPYFTKDDRVAIMAASGGGVKIYERLSVEEAELWIAANTTSQRATKRKLLYILNMNGIVTVETNMTIAIDQTNQLRDSLLDRYVKLTPTIYDPNNPKISKKAQKFLGKFASKNPPKYADIELSEVITDEHWEALNGDEILEGFLAWKKFISSPKAANITHQETEEYHAPKEAVIFPEKSEKKGMPNVDYEELDKQAYQEEDPGDDLPF
jgi:hypothetical protein